MAFFLVTFLSPDIVMCINRHVPLSIITDYDARFIVRDSCVSFNFIIIIIIKFVR